MTPTVTHLPGLICHPSPRFEQTATLPGTGRENGASAYHLRRASYGRELSRRARPYPAVFTEAGRARCWPTKSCAAFHAGNADFEFRPAGGGEMERPLAPLAGPFTADPALAGEDRGASGQGRPFHAERVGERVGGKRSVQRQFGQHRELRGPEAMVAEAGIEDPCNHPRNPPRRKATAARQFAEFRRIHAKSVYAFFPHVDRNGGARDRHPFAIVPGAQRGPGPRGPLRPSSRQFTPHPHGRGRGGQPAEPRTTHHRANPHGADAHPPPQKANRRPRGHRFDQFFKMVRSRRLELPRVAPQRPQRCASTSSATTAKKRAPCNKSMGGLQGAAGPSLAARRCRRRPLAAGRVSQGIVTSV